MSSLLKDKHKVGTCFGWRSSWGLWSLCRECRWLQFSQYLCQCCLSLPCFQLSHQTEKNLDENLSHYELLMMNSRRFPLLWQIQAFQKDTISQKVEKVCFLVLQSCWELVLLNLGLEKLKVWSSSLLSKRFWSPRFPQL